MTEAAQLGLLALVSTAAAIEYGYRKGIFKIFARMLLQEALFNPAPEVPKEKKEKKDPPQT